MSASTRARVGTRPSISVCLIVKNEALLLGRCLRSIRPIADELLVVDTGSSDATIGIARRAGARIVTHRWTGSFAAARNTYLREARGNWILTLDGDEAIAPADLPAIERLVRRPGVIGYRPLIRNYTGEYDLMWKWSPNDGRYQTEERVSKSPGWMMTRNLRLFRNFDDVAYSDAPTSHATPLNSLLRHRGRIEDRDDFVIHHFQCLKGGPRFLDGKQRRKLPAEVAHARRHPDDVPALLNIAKTLFANRRDSEAVRYLRRAISHDDAFHDGYQLWGMIDFENGRLASAERRLRRAAAIDPRSADAWCLLGMVLVESGQFDDARQALEKAIALHAGHLLAYNSLGVLLEEIGDLAGARRAYRTALRLHSGFAPARANFDRVRLGRRRRVARS